MFCKLFSLKHIILIACIIFATKVVTAQTDIYWVGGNGDWDNVNMWYKDAAGVNSAGTIPHQNSIVHFTDQSSSTLHGM